MLSDINRYHSFGSSMTVFYSCHIQSLKSQWLYQIFKSNTELLISWIVQKDNLICVRQDPKTYKRTGLPYYFLIYINYILSQTKIYQNGIQKLMAMHKFLLMAYYHKIYDNHNGCNIQAQIPYNRRDVAALFESYIANRKLVFLLI